MKDWKFFGFKGRSFTLYILIAMVILVFIVVGLVTLNNYNDTKKIFEKNSRHLKDQTEKDILITIKLTDQSYDLYDSSLNEQMQRGLNKVLADYQRSGGNP